MQISKIDEAIIKDVRVKIIDLFHTTCSKELGMLPSPMYIATRLAILNDLLTNEIATVITTLGMEGDEIDNIITMTTDEIKGATHLKLLPLKALKEKRATV